MASLGLGFRDSRGLGMELEVFEEKLPNRKHTTGVTIKLVGSEDLSWEQEQEQAYRNEVLQFAGLVNVMKRIAGQK